jgi:hypothetical protein
MKKIVKVPVTEVDGEGLTALLGKKVMLFCLNYIYTGELVGVNTTCVLLEKASIVYETGEFSSSKFKEAQSLPHAVYVQIGAIESFMETNKT